MGSLLGMFVASNVVLSSLQSDAPEVREVGFSNLDEAAKTAIRLHDLEVIRNPYVILGCVVVLMFLLIAVFVKTARKTEDEQSAPKAKFTHSVKRLFGNRIYREGVIAQVFYVATQIMT